MGLENLYKTFYSSKYSSFAYFLLEASNQNIQINWQHNLSSIFSIQTFVLNPNIMELYEKNEIQGIIDKYCKKKEDTYILNKTFLNTNEINTISYYFFINQYYSYLKLQIIGSYLLAILYHNLLLQLFF